MGKNDFRVDTTSSEKKTFFKKKQTLLGLAFLLTVPQMFSAVILPIQWLWVQGMEWLLMSLPLHRRNCISL